MRILGDSWCFCNGGGGGKSEKTKAAIYSGKGGAMATVNGGGTGFLIHRNLLLTTHANLPSVSAAEAAEIRLHNGLSATLFPHRFFITSSVLDLTMVGLDTLDGESNTQQPHFLKTPSKSNLELGSTVYLLGHTTAEKQELTVGEGKVVIATDNLIKLSTDEITYSPGSAGFDVHGNLSFMVCDPMKLSASPNLRSSSNSSSSSRKDIPTQFGIPIPIICDWLNQNWEGNLDELNKPRLPLMRLMSSSGQRSEHSCASFTKRRVFKTTEGENEVATATTPSSSNVIVSKQIEQLGPSLTADPQSSAAHPQGIPSPEIYESPLLNSVPLKKRDDGSTANAQIQLLDINFPPWITKPSMIPSPKQQSKEALPNDKDRNYIKNLLLQESNGHNLGPANEPPVPDAESTGSVNGAEGKAQSSRPSNVDLSEEVHDYSSEGETTMYSAETAESRNIPLPKQSVKLYPVGRSQSCVNYNSRWGPLQRNTVARGATLEKHGSFLARGRRVYSQGANSQRSNDYFSPTVSSVMKKRNTPLEQHSRPRLGPAAAAHSSAKWNF